jgi:hypothetical protein
MARRDSPPIPSLLLPPNKDYENDDGKKTRKRKRKRKRGRILAAQPHGVLTYVAMYEAIANPESSVNTPTAVASILLITPIMHNLMGIFNLVDASGPSLRSHLTSKKGGEGGRRRRIVRHRAPREVPPRHDTRIDLQRGLPPRAPVHPVGGIGRAITISRHALVVGVRVADIRFDARASRVVEMGAPGGVADARLLRLRERAHDRRRRRRR